MIGMLRNVGGNVSAMPRTLHIRFHCVMHLLQNVLDRVRHAIEGMLIKVNVLRSAGLIPAGKNNADFFVSKTLNGDFICEFVNYTTSFLHTVISSEQERLLYIIVKSMKESLTGAFQVSGRHYRGSFSWQRRNSDVYKNCNNLLNARNLDQVIRKNGLEGSISIPKRSKITCNKNQDLSSHAIRSIILEEKVEDGFCQTSKDYDKNANQFDDAAKAFAVLSRELVNVGLLYKFRETISGIVTNFKRHMANPDTTFFEHEPDQQFIRLMRGNVEYTQKENDQYLAHLISIDDFRGAKEFPRFTNEENEYGINDIACLAIPFIFFYKHSELMLTELKKTGLLLTIEQKKFLEYCSGISEFRANCWL